MPYFARLSRVLGRLRDDSQRIASCDPLLRGDLDGNGRDESGSAASGQQHNFDGLGGPVTFPGGVIAEGLTILYFQERMTRRLR